MNVEWVGNLVRGKKAEDWWTVIELMDNVNVGLREDGVVVWEKVPEVVEGEFQKLEDQPK